MRSVTTIATLVVGLGFATTGLAQRGLVLGPDPMWIVGAVSLPAAAIADGGIAFTLARGGRAPKGWTLTGIGAGLVTTAGAAAFFSYAAQYSPAHENAALELTLAALPLAFGLLTTGFAAWALALDLRQGARAATDSSRPTVRVSVAPMIHGDPSRGTAMPGLALAAWW